MKRILILLLFAFVASFLYHLIFKVLPSHFGSSKKNFHSTSSQKKAEQELSGKEVYRQYCKNCHAQNPIIITGAPRKGDEKAWSPRISKEISQLLKDIDEGYPLMPPRGGCFECTDKELLAAINHMLPDKLKKNFSENVKKQF